VETVSQKRYLDNLTREKEITRTRKKETKTNHPASRTVDRQKIPLKEKNKNTAHSQRHSVPSDLKQREVKQNQAQS